MYLIAVLVPFIFLASVIDDASGDQPLPNRPQTQAADSSSPKTPDKKDKERDVREETVSAYEQILATTDKFRALLKRQPDSVVALQRYPALLSRQLKSFVDLRRQAAKSGLQSEPAKVASTPQKLSDTKPSPPKVRSPCDRDALIDKTHRAPDPAELRRRAVENLRKAMPEIDQRQVDQAASLLEKMSKNLEQQQHDAAQLTRHLDELDQVFQNFSQPPKAEKTDDPKEAKESEKKS